MTLLQSRRDFAATLSLAGAAGMIGGRAALANEGPPETTTLRLRHDPGTCISPLYVAEELLHGEGFTDVRYVDVKSGVPLGQMIARGELDFVFMFAASAARHLDTGVPATVLAGVHPGCFELFAYEPIRTISDLKGKKVGIDVLGSGLHVYVAIMAAHVGLDPDKDIEWVESGSSNIGPLELFAEGKADAMLASYPDSQELHARKVGRVILNTTTDKPWSHYFCCMLTGNRDFVRSHPVATRRVLRAILRADDMCAAEPGRAAQRLVDRGLLTTRRYDYVLQTLREIPYRAWRDYDAADSMRFFALRLHEVGMIKSSPAQLIAEGTDWRFLNELKRELKA